MQNGTINGSLQKQLGITTSTITAAAKAPMPPIIQILLAVALVCLPFVIIGITGGFIFSIYKSKSMKQKIFYFRRNGNIDTLEIDKNVSRFDVEANRHFMMPDRPKWFSRHWLFGFYQPVRFFVEGDSSEKTLKAAQQIIGKEIEISGGIYSGDDLANSEYIQAKMDSELAQKVFKPGKDAAFMIVLAIAALLAGGIAGAMIHTYMAKASADAAAKSAAKTAVTVTTTILGVRK